jgi:hypothetical protein
MDFEIFLITTKNNEIIKKMRFLYLKILTNECK